MGHGGHSATRRPPAAAVAAPPPPPLPAGAEQGTAPRMAQVVSLARPPYAAAVAPPLPAAPPAAPRPRAAAAPPPPLCEPILRIIQLLGEEAAQAPCACAGQGTQGEEAWRRARRLGLGGCACVRDVRIERAGGRARAGRRAAVSRAARAAGHHRAGRRRRACDHLLRARRVEHPDVPSRSSPTSSSTKATASDAPEPPTPTEMTFSTLLDDSAKLLQRCVACRIKSLLCYRRTSVRVIHKVCSSESRFARGEPLDW